MWHKMEKKTGGGLVCSIAADLMDSVILVLFYNGNEWKLF